MCCNRTVIYTTTTTTQLVQIWRRPYVGKSTSDLSKLRKVKGHLANRQIKIPYACDVTRDPSSNRQCYQCNDCNGRFTTLQSVRDNMWSRRLCRVVKRKSCETYWILLGRLMSYDGACVVWGRSPVDIDGHKLSSWKIVHQCEHVSAHWWTSFQLLT